MGAEDAAVAAVVGPEGSAEVTVGATLTSEGGPTEEDFSVRL